MIKPLNALGTPTVRSQMSSQQKNNNSGIDPYGIYEFLSCNNGNTTVMRDAFEEPATSLQVFMLNLGPFALIPQHQISETKN